MPRTKVQDAARKKAAYHSNSEYRERHKAAMRLRYHLRKAERAAAQIASETSESESSASETSESESSESSQSSMSTHDSTYMSD